MAVGAMAKTNKKRPVKFEDCLRYPTKEELQKEALDHLSQAWNAFVRIQQVHSDDVPDFRRAIHECQRIIATQKMREIDPETWGMDPWILIK